MKYRKYTYSLKDISDGKKEAFRAIVPAFENAIVFGDSKKEIEEGIECLIEYYVDRAKNKGKGTMKKTSSR